MSATETYDRFEELYAGRALGDLSAEEVMECKELVQTHQSESSGDFDWISAELELRNSEPCPLSSSLVTRLNETISAFAEKNSNKPASADLISIIPWLGWALAACLLAFFNLPSSDTPLPSPELTVAQKLEVLRDAPDTQRLDFTPASDPYAKISGEVVWNDGRQEGYMSLVNLPVNDPTKKQYQLWIVDPKRDEIPVDGGVFDIPAGSETAVIPIRNALQVSKPTVFVITLEQPGGVVKSKQEVVVALAKS
ncbi:MAG TPA: hypothetical protein DCX67_04985 [Opitutae bacterium]|nr:hypothetical protein [Opitutae bacterium]